MDLLLLALLAWVATAIVMLALWRYQQRHGNAAVVDVAWVFGIGVVAVGFAAIGPGDPSRRVLVAILAGVWSVRLGLYLLRDRVIGAEEDGRYTLLRERWGDDAPRRLLIFFQAQALRVVLFALPVIPAVASPAPFFAWHDIAGLAVWALAIAGASLADLQLERFRAHPENLGRTCRNGLWRFSRHPNYFFEWTHGFAYVLLAAGSPWWWAALAGPLAVLVLLVKVTGIPWSERQALRSRGEDYRRYRESTSAFFPWLPKRDSTPTSG